MNLEPKGPSLQTRADQLQQIGKAFSDKVVQENGFRPLEQDTSGIAQLDKQIEKEKQELISTLLGKNYVSNDDQLQKIISVVKQEPNSYVVELLEHYLFYDKNVSTTDTVVKSALESIQNLEYIKQKDTKREVE